MADITRVTGDSANLQLSQCKGGTEEKRYHRTGVALEQKKKSGVKEVRKTPPMIKCRTESFATSTL